MSERRTVHFVFAALAYCAIVAVLHAQVFKDFGGIVLSGTHSGAMHVWEFWWHHSGFREFPPGDPSFTRALMHPAGMRVFVTVPLVIALGSIFQTFTGPVQAYNALFLLGYAGSGAGAYALAYRVTRDKAASFFGGFAFMFSNYALTQHQLGHLGDSFTVFVPLYFLGLVLLFDEPGPRAALVFLAAALGVTATSAYVSLSCLVIGTAVFAAARAEDLKKRSGEGWFRAGFFGSLAAAGAFGLFCYWPFIAAPGPLIGGSTETPLFPYSFFMFPLWHPSEWVRAFREAVVGAGDPVFSKAPLFIGRPELAMRTLPENAMGFLGYSLAGTLALGLRSVELRKYKVWLLIAAAGAVLALGPRLCWDRDPTAIPLPYAALKALPFLSIFRTYSRLVLLMTVGVSVLSAAAFASLFPRRRGWPARAAALAALLGVYSWETALPAAASHAVRYAPDPAHLALAADPSPGAVLALPAGITKEGDVTINVQRYMLDQTFHRRPLVLGRLARHSWADLDFCLNTGLVYELTHPHVIEALYRDEKLAPRRLWLKRHGAEALRDGGVRFVLFHGDDWMFSDRVKGDVLRLLSDALGPPENPGGAIMLFRVPPTVTFRNRTAD